MKPAKSLAKKAKRVAVSKAVDREMATLEKAATKAAPGLLEYLSFYEDYMATIRRAEAYLAPLQPSGGMLASNSSAS